MKNLWILQDHLNDDWIEENLKQQQKLWSRKQLLEEVESRKSSKLKKKDFEFEAFSYDNRTSFNDLINSMQTLPDYEGLIYYKKVRENPNGRKISDSVIDCDIVAYLDKNAEALDNTLGATDSNIMDLNERKIVDGLRVAINSMREFEVTSYIVDSKLAYGKLGAYPSIPGEAKILYKIRINRVWGESKLMYFLNLEHIEQKGTDDNLLHEALVSYKNCANALFRGGHFLTAIKYYRTILNCLRETFINETQKVNSPKFDLMKTILLNIAATYLKIEKFKYVSKCAKDVFSMDPLNLKAAYMLIKAKIELGKLDQALAYLKWIETISPENTDFDDIRWILYIRMQDQEPKR